MLFESGSPFPPANSSTGAARRGPLAAEPAEAADVERAILKKRARELARPLSAPSEAPGLAEFVILRIADERYLVEASSIRDAVTAREFTPLPGVPAFVSGITVIRGRIVAIADLRRLLGLPGRGPAEATTLVVLEHRGIEFALAVDQVSIPASGTINAPAVLPAGGPDPKFLRGVTADGLILLDLGAISSALIVNEEI